MQVTRLAPAKINLMLHVVGRLPDGYHHLQSLVTFVPFGDIITVAKADTSRLTLDGPFANEALLTADNSMVKAAQWLKERFPIIKQVHLHLTKNLPVASGMGGGSSDAAAAIAALLKSHEIFLSFPEENELILASGALGADVPMCLAHQLGRGDLLWIDSSGREVLPVSVQMSLLGAIVLINPLVPISTPIVFKGVHPPYTSPQNFKDVLAKDFQGDLLRYLQNQRNDLMEPAIIQESKIQEMISMLQGLPRCLLVRMSGSGATCFGVFEDGTAAKAAYAAALNKKYWTHMVAGCRSYDTVKPDGL